MAQTAAKRQSGSNTPLARRVLLHEITPTNFLSFGLDTPPIRLGALNVIIGPNGSGKSNLIEAICFLRESPQDIRALIRRGGGVQEWIWKGAISWAARLEAIVAIPLHRPGIRHSIVFDSDEQSFRLDDERIQNESAVRDSPETVVFYSGEPYDQWVNVAGERRELKEGTVDPDKSILAQLRDPLQYP